MKIQNNLHSSNHNEEILGNTKVYNVSLLDERYMITYDPLILELKNNILFVNHKNNTVQLKLETNEY